MGEKRRRRENNMYAREIREKIKENEKKKNTKMIELCSVKKPATSSDSKII